MLQALGNVRLAQPLEGEVQRSCGYEGIILNLLAALEGDDLVLLVNLSHLVLRPIPLREEERLCQAKDGHGRCTVWL